MPDLPPELAMFCSLPDTEPEPVRAAFHYCLILVMVESGVARLVGTHPGDALRVCVFETVAGGMFSLAKSAISRQNKENLVARSKGILSEEGSP